MVMEQDTLQGLQCTGNETNLTLYDTDSIRECNHGNIAGAEVHVQCAAWPIVCQFLIFNNF